jgi:glutamyl-tRNA synthetase
MEKLAGFFKEWNGEWKADVLKEEVSSMIKADELNFGAVMNSLRLAMVGGSFGPDLFTIIEVLGQDEVVARIEKAVEVLGK